MPHLWANQSVGQTLVIALGVIMGDEAENGRAQRLLARQDHPLQTGFYFSPACQLVTTVSGHLLGRSVGDSSSTRKRWPSGVTS
jgi:hypothetical protein